jgi:NUMOD4 motif/HNH endonuclease
MSSEVDRDRNRYGGLVVLSTTGNRFKRALCQCDCGGRTTVTLRHLVSGAVRHCGCSRSAPKPILVKKAKQERPENLKKIKSTRIGRPPLPPGTTKKEIRQAANRKAREDAKAAKAAAEQAWKERARLVCAEILASKRKPFLVPVATNVPPEGTVEEWRPCPGYEDSYAVSNLGRVMRTSPENNALVGRILKQDNNHPYGKVRLRSGGKARLKKVHRLVAVAFVENLKGPGAEVHHIDDCRCNNWSGNLEWLTSSEHHKRTELSGRTIAAPGEDNHNAYLTWETVREIRKRYVKGGVTQRALAREFFVNRKTIQLLIAGRTWKEQFTNAQVDSALSTLLHSISKDPLEDAKTQERAVELGAILVTEHHALTEGLPQLAA